MNKHSYKFFYNLLIIISQGIVSYYVIIEFLKTIDKIGLRIMFDKFPPFNPEVLIQALDRLIEKHINRQELDYKKFDDNLKNYYNNLSNPNLIKSKISSDLLKIQRIVITPTLYLVFPNSSDPGNRVVRDYLEDKSDALRIVFKNEGSNESEIRWTNQLLIEFIKFSLKKGIRLMEKHFKFFCYSQSQFRSLSCWLLTSPEEILEKCGKITEKKVSKFGARLGQCLTTTTKTIIMKDYNCKKEDDVKDNDHVFSDGVAPMSFDIAQEISKVLGLETVPSAFQGRFLGCKGVWSVIKDDHLPKGN